MNGQGASHRCPVCGVGELVDVTYRGGSEGEAPEEMQLSDSLQVETYSCGHEVVGERLDRTSDELEVEHRTTDETVEPL